MLLSHHQQIKTGLENPDKQQGNNKQTIIFRDGEEEYTYRVYEVLEEQGRIIDSNFLVENNGFIKTKEGMMYTLNDFDKLVESRIFRLTKNFEM